VIHLAISHDVVQAGQDEPIVDVPRAVAFQCASHSKTHFRTTRPPNVACTNHRVFRHPSTTVEALDACRALRSAPAAVPLRPGPRHWGIFDSLCTEAGAKANAVPDAYHAALAIENGATWVTTDTAFARFPGLSWRRPFD
jgi:predicted nucleic acid-binding protein